MLRLVVWVFATSIFAQGVGLCIRLKRFGVHSITFLIVWVVVLEIVSTGVEDMLLAESSSHLFDLSALSAQFRRA